MKALICGLLELYCIKCCKVNHHSNQNSINLFLINSSKDLIKKIKNVDYKFNKNLYISNSAKKIIKRCLTFDPDKRITPQEALNHEWFT